MDTLFLNEHRCKCGKLLLKGIFFDATLEIKCKKCGIINKIGHIKMPEQSSHYGLIINKNGIITNVSKTACDILGYDCHELIGKNFTQINKTLSNEIGEKFFGPKSVLNENNYLKFETIHQSKDGKNIPIIANLKLYRPNENDKYVLLSARLKNSEDLKNDKKENNPEFIDSACDFYFDIDKEGLVIFNSPYLEEILKYSSNEGMGKSFFDFVPHNKIEQVKKTFNFFCNKKQPYKISGNLGFDVKGKIMNLELYFTPNFNDDGVFIGYRVLGWVVD